MSERLLWRRCWLFGRNGCDIQSLVNDLGNRLYLRPKLLLDAVQVESVFICDKVDGETQVSETTGSSNTVKVGFRVFREVKVDDDVYSLDINATRKQVRTNEVPTYAVTEIVEYAITVRLQHFRV